MNTSARLHAFCQRRLKRVVAKRLGISAPFLSYLLKHRDLDALVAKIRNLPVRSETEGVES